MRVDNRPPTVMHLQVEIHRYSIAKIYQRPAQLTQFHLLSRRAVASRGQGK